MHKDGRTVKKSASLPSRPPAFCWNLRGTLTPSLADSFGFAPQSFPCARCRDSKASGECISAEVTVQSWKALSRSEAWAGGRLATQAPAAVFL